MSLSVGVVTLIVSRKFLVVHYPSVAGSTDFMSEYFQLFLPCLVAVFFWFVVCTFGFFSASFLLARGAHSHELNYLHECSAS